MRTALAKVCWGHPQVPHCFGGSIFGAYLNTLDGSVTQRNRAEMVDLKVDTSMLDPAFNGYKLSLDPLPIKELKVDGAVERKSSPDQFSMQHMQIFSEATPLVNDPFTSTDASTTMILLKGDGSVHKISFDHASHQFEPATPVTSVSLPDSSVALPPCVHLPAEEFAVVSDGVKNITMFHTSKDRLTWKSVLSFAPFEAEGFYLRDCRVKDDKVHLLVQTIYEHKERSKDDKIVFDLALHWIVLASENDGPLFEIWRHHVNLDSPVDTASFDVECENMMFISAKPPRSNEETSADKIAEQDEDIEMEGETGDDGKSAYIWAENGEEISILFHLDHRVNKEDVQFETARDAIIVRVGQTSLLEGQLGGPILPGNSVWTLTEKKSLEVTLFKDSSALTSWNELVKGDKRGHFHSDVTQMAEAAERLRRFTSDNQAVGCAGVNENFNSAQLEECDMTEDDMSSLYWWNIQTSKTETHCDITGHTLLFSTNSSKGERPPQICLRHDVDGILWTLDGKHPPVHTATFNAFAYVQASKSLRRFSGCSPDHSYAVICETNNHAFIYWQPHEVQSDLRNRKTSTKINEVARQQIVSLKERADMSGKQDRILAVNPTNTELFLLTPDTLYAVSVK